MPRHRILLVDDTATNRVLQRTVLEAAGYEVEEATTGAEALERLQGQPFDLMILDLLLPEMDGFEVLEAWRGLSRPGEMPILVMSALGDEEARIRALRLGASDFLLRPAGRAELMARVAGLLRAKTLQERLDEAFNKLTAMGRASEVHLAELNALGILLSDPLPSLVEQLRAASRPGRDPDLIAAMERVGPGFRGSVFLAHGPRVEISMDCGAARGGRVPTYTQPIIGVWKAGDSREAPWISCLVRALEPTVSELRNLSYCITPGIALASGNFPEEPDSLNAEVVRGFALHWEFVKRMSALNREIEEAFEYTISALSRAAEANDPSVGAHLKRVNAYSRELAEAIGMPPHFVRTIAVQAQLHDVGKIQISMDLLKKPSRLDADEYEVMKAHTWHGAHILGDHPRLQMAASIALNHHEHWDGTGYPRGLRGAEIPLEGRIAKLADVYDALRSVRPYKPSMAHRYALDAIFRGDGRVAPEHFDPELLDALRRIAPRFHEIHEDFAKTESGQEPVPGHGESPAGQWPTETGRDP